MELSESVRRNIIELSAGAILNKFKLMKRRDVAFFDEVFYDYIAFAERYSEGQDTIHSIGREWMVLYFNVLVPPGFRKIPPTIFINNIMKRIWITLGLLKDINANAESGNLIRIQTTGEKITDILGRNSFLPGLYRGVLEGLYGKEVEIKEVKQTRRNCRYVFEVTDSAIKVDSKTPTEYFKLNDVKYGFSKGISLKTALEKKVFRIREDNRLYFRNKSVSIVENTIFHLIGIENFRLNRISEKCCEFFREVLDFSSRNMYLSFLRSMIELMGWGKVVVEDEGDEIRVHINGPPYGLQKHGDNWSFLANCIEGYLKSMEGGERFALSKIKEKDKSLKMVYTRS